MTRFHAASRISLFCALVAAAGCTNLHVVEEGRVYRSAQPERQQLETWIWRYDLRTVVRLRGSGPGSASYHASRDPAELAGIDFVHIPMSAVRFPEKQTLVDLCEVYEHAEYPILFHCFAGADRTGLASAAYVLHRTGDLAQAREQLAFLPYLHTGLLGADKADLVLDMYEPWEGVLSFCDWARTVYEKPDPDVGVTESYLEEQRARAAAARPAEMR